MVKDEAAVEVQRTGALGCKVPAANSAFTRDGLIEGLATGLLLFWGQSGLARCASVLFCGLPIGAHRARVGIGVCHLSILSTGFVRFP